MSSLLGKLGLGLLCLVQTRRRVVDRVHVLAYQKKTALSQLAMEVQAELIWNGKNGERSATIENLEFTSREARPKEGGKGPLTGTSSSIREQRKNLLCIFWQLESTATTRLG